LEKVSIHYLPLEHLHGFQQVDGYGISLVDRSKRRDEGVEVKTANPPEK
jgi:hypothetical protein